MLGDRRDVAVCGASAGVVVVVHDATLGQDAAAHRHDRVTDGRIDGQGGGGSANGRRRGCRCLCSCRRAGRGLLKLVATVRRAREKSRYKPTLLLAVMYLEQLVVPVLQVEQDRATGRAECCQAGDLSNDAVKRYSVLLIALTYTKTRRGRRRRGVGCRLVWLLACAAVGIASAVCTGSATEQVLLDGRHRLDHPALHGWKFENKCAPTGQQ